MDVSVIIPTYKEAGNLPELSERISAAFRGGENFEIIIVDDDSPDGTADVALLLAKSYPITLLSRKKRRGLSSAAVLGMENARGEVLIVMDGDLSHPPEKIPELISALGENTFVLGSRYTSGGKIDDNWNRVRYFISQIAGLLARPLVKVSDPMSGFFALHKHSFARVSGILQPLGYKIGLELMVKLRAEKIAEIPIHFYPRKWGRSKLSVRVQLDYLLQLYNLYRYHFGGR